MLTKMKLRKENGDANIVTAILVIPIFIFLILALIDVSYYFQARSAVQSVTRDAARHVAIYGGNNNKALNPYSTTIAKKSLENLYKGGKCTASGCSKPPKMSCTPGITTKAGAEVSCTTTYYYKVINPANPITQWFGFASQSFQVTEYAKAETGF